jgi:hypothetical protein
MRPSDKLFAALVKYDQVDLPHLAREIDNGHPTANTKDRLRDLHKMMSVLIRYVVVEGSEKHGSVLQAATVPTNAQAPAQAVAQHFPATSAPSLGAPPMRVANVVVSDSLSLGVPAAVTMPDVDPEPDNTIQVVTRRDGSSVVIPPRGSRAPKKTFPAGQGVDATYITAFDAVPADPNDPASILG